MSSFINLLVILAILCFENGQLIVLQPIPNITEQLDNDWDILYKKNMTSYIKVYAHDDKRYFISDFKATYIEAMTFCHEINMNLVQIESEKENEAIYKYIRDTNRGDTFWTSGTNLLDGHHWIWITKFQPISYTNWKKGEPGNINEHCISINHVKNSGLFWNDLDCNAKINFICEKDLSQSATNRGSYQQYRDNGVFHESSVSPNIALLHFEDKVYFVGRYLRVTYMEALQLCSMMNMRLVSINSKEENYRLHKYIRDTNAGDKFWSSGTRLLDGKNWMWMSNAKPVYYTNWATNEPDNQNHLCIQLDNLKNDGLFWNDYDCSTKNFYICEKQTHDSFPKVKQGDIDHSLSLFKQNESEVSVY